MAVRRKLAENVFLTAQQTDKFKTGVFSCCFLRPMEEAAENALLTSILMRGCLAYPTMRQMSCRTDALFGAGIGPLLLKKGDLQVVGFDCEFLDDAWARENVFEQTAELLRQILCRPLLENRTFLTDYVTSERRNLAAAMDSTRNDRGMWCEQLLMESVFAGQGYAIPRIGTRAQLDALQDDTLPDVYRRLLHSSRVELCYLGSLQEDEAAEICMGLASELSAAQIITPQTVKPGKREWKQFRKALPMNQSCLSCCFTAPDDTAPQYAPMTVFQTVFGGGETNRLYMQLRETHGLCYAAGSWYDGRKGVLMASCGCEKKHLDRAQKLLLEELEHCRNGDLTGQELENARMELLAHLDSLEDDARLWQSFLLSGACCGREKEIYQLKEELCQVTLPQVAEAARHVELCGIGRLEEEAP